ncbi:hypothetical protein B1759_14700 [Rubrivirga sp. SAORIC476]|uniref:hypothetical protein n=1 Tax=Rubrivirga sp. SAORIC476 TaxID=1961794 RepID=UPI000BA9451A|nr:hypothetical protein [Rubrivirga sp. SAORIC476]PAP79568.1 hypothetical protein B1759_14700 [Rubrivirga sp. SAORIC476]
MNRLLPVLLLLASVAVSAQTPLPVTPPEFRGSINAERQGLHDANRMRTLFYNYGMVGDFQGGADLSVFHSVEVPRGIGLNYSDGITPYVLAKVTQANGTQAYIMLTGFRERQATSPISSRIMRFEPRPGYAEADPTINAGRSTAISNDFRTWPGAAAPGGVFDPASDPTECWYDKRDDPDDPGWCGSWNGFFGKRPNADQESFYVMDDNLYDAFGFFPDSRDRTRRGLGLRVEVRGFQWSNPQAQDVIFWHYDIVNESTTQYDDIIFGLYMDSGVGGSGISCDGVAESDDDNARFVQNVEGRDLDLVYTWDEGGNGVSLRSNCEKTGYLGYAYLETPGDATDGIDNDDDGIIDERRDNGPGDRIEGQENIRAAMLARGYDLSQFETEYGALETRPAYVAGVWWTGDEDLDWTAEFSDTGRDGVYADDATFGSGVPDTGENDGMPTDGEPNFNQTDITESDQIGLTGFKLNRIRGAGETDGIVFFTNEQNWPERLYNQFSNPDPNVAFDPTIVNNYNVGFLFASGPFTLDIGRRERFSLALAYGSNLTDLQDNVEVVQSIYDANYRFATPPPLPTVQAFAEDGKVTLVWDTRAERSIDPVTNLNDFEGYRIYRSTDPNFLDPQVILDGRGTGPLGNGRPEAQFDLANGITGYSNISVSGIQYYLGSDTGLTHRWTDDDVVNGQTYYYAVTSYDSGSEAFNFYPSESPITVSRTLRGGTILPPNVVQVRPNARVPGYVGATASEVTQTSGTGTGTVSAEIVNSDDVPEGRFRVEFQGSADSVAARTYSLIDLSTGEPVFEGGTDFSGERTGPIAFGIQPIVTTLDGVQVEPDASGFTSGSTSTVLLGSHTGSIPRNLIREGYPEDVILTFADTPISTSRAAIGQPATPAKFKPVGATSGFEYEFFYRELNGDNTLSASGEFIDLLTRNASGALRPTWRIEWVEGADAPGQGDVYRLVVLTPFGPGDAFEFTTSPAFVDAARAANQFEEQEPYVVPNPYVAAASFEPERFATAGRGPRRIEFRAIPAGATIRIYTVTGDLVQTLQHDGFTTGMVPWDLRSKDNLEVAPGLYLFHVDAPDVGESVGRFAIIK